MKKRKLLLWVMLVVLTGCWSMVWLLREPTYQGKTLQEWVSAGSEHTNDPASRQGLARILPRAVPYYTKLLKKKDSWSGHFYEGIWLKLPDFSQDLLPQSEPAERTRIRAALVLKCVGPPASAALTALVECLKDPSEAVRQSAVEALDEIDPGSEAMLPVFMGACRDSFYGVRRGALEALGRYGSKAQAAIPSVTERLGDNHPMVRACGAGALWEIARQTNETLRVLAETLHDPESSVRAMSARCLGRMGPAAQPTVAALAEALKDNKEVLEEAREALRKIDPATAARAGAK